MTDGVIPALAVRPTSESMTTTAHARIRASQYFASVDLDSRAGAFAPSPNDAW
jgi:hypothetical protein